MILRNDSAHPTQAQGARLLLRTTTGCAAMVVSASFALVLMALARPVAHELQSARSTLEELRVVGDAQVTRSWWELDLDTEAPTASTNWITAARADLCATFSDGTGYCQRIEPVREATFSSFLSDWGPQLPWLDAQGDPRVDVYMSAATRDWLASHPPRLMLDIPAWQPDASALDVLGLQIDAPADRVRAAWSHRGPIPTVGAETGSTLRIPVRQQELLLPQVTWPRLVPWVLLAIPVLVAAGAPAGLPFPWLLRAPLSLALAFLCFVGGPLLLRLPGPPGHLLTSVRDTVVGQVTGTARVYPVEQSRVALGELSDVGVAWTPDTSTDAALFSAFDLFEPPSALPTSDLEVLEIVSSRLVEGMRQLDDDDADRVLQEIARGVDTDRLQMQLPLVPMLDDVLRSNRPLAARPLAGETLQRIATTYAPLADDDYWGDKVRLLLEPFGR